MCLKCWSTTHIGHKVRKNILLLGTNKAIMTWKKSALDTVFSASLFNCGFSSVLRAFAYFHVDTCWVKSYFNILVHNTVFASFTHPPCRLLGLSCLLVSQRLHWACGKWARSLRRGGAVEPHRPVSAIQSAEREGGGWRKKTNWVGRSLFLARRKTERLCSRRHFKHQLPPLV